MLHCSIRTQPSASLQNPLPACCDASEFDPCEGNSLFIGKTHLLKGPSPKRHVSSCFTMFLCSDGGGWQQHHFHDLPEISAWSADFATTGARNPNSSNLWPWPSQPRLNLVRHGQNHEQNHGQIMGKSWANAPRWTQSLRDPTESDGQMHHQITIIFSVEKLLGQSAFCISDTSSDMLVDAHTWMVSANFQNMQGQGKPTNLFISVHI